MRTLFLKDILTSMGIRPYKAHRGVSISEVIHNKSYAGHNTLYFQLRKRTVLDGKKYKDYDDFYIVTDAPFVNMDKLKPEQIIMVDDVVRSFFKFTSYYRHLFNIPIVAVTGTCGKTTTKEMLKHILQKDFTVQATISNQNTGYFNLPYLMGIDDETDIAIIETAVSGYGHMMETCKHFFPNIGIITMIDVDHTDNFPSFRDYIAEKENLMKGLNNKGTLIINVDDPNILSMNFSKYKGKIVTYGKSKNADFNITDILFNESKMHFKVNYKGKLYNGVVPGMGEHNVYNATASIAAAIEVGININTAIKRLASFHHLNSRFQIIEGRNQVTIIDDTWKSNPASLKNGLSSLKKMSLPTQRTIAVLGRMAALGIYAAEEYAKAGRLLKELGIDILITKGFITKDIGRAAIHAGMKKENIYHFSQAEEMKAFLDSFLQPNDLLYFKTGGNDGVFDEIIQYLKKDI
ncbi:Mur ligase family protein [Bacillus aerolatus]|uniref:Mur ligase family protein n=1 Tax=Bacillus aerolatus TaxID=2653354 RepID=UPI001786F4AB|nr:UDP-N-acetylmuramoyl-tripeptide--D-alanyl-D-alanine ligase [Bacillus aerolatus]